MSHPIKQKSAPFHTFYNHDREYSLDISTQVKKCPNQYYWNLIQQRVLYKKYGVTYKWSSLDESVHLFNDNSYKNLTITFRDTVDNVERFIEHPSIFVISISQMPLEDILGNYPTSDWPRGTYCIMKSDDTFAKEEYSGNWVNGLFANQVQRFFNEEEPLPLEASKISGIGSLIRNSIYGRNSSNHYYDPLANKGRIEYDDIINPDERMYNITFQISSNYFVATHILEHKLFDLIRSKFGDINRTYLSCDQFLYALDMLDNMQRSGYYGMKLRKYEKDLDSNFNLNNILN